MATAKARMAGTETWWDYGEVTAEEAAQTISREVLIFGRDRAVIEARVGGGPVERFEVSRKVVYTIGRWKGSFSE